MRLRHTLPLLSACALLASSALADSRQAALGADGTLYRVQSGWRSELLPGSAGSDQPVLLLGVTRPDGSVARLVVPGTEGDEFESGAEVVYEEAADAVYLIWESRTNLIHSQIRLVSFSQGGWSLPMSLPGEFFSLKTSPSLAVTRDTFVALGADGEPETHARTLYHAVWWEEAAAGERVVYSPVLLLDGAHVGWSPFFVLNEVAATTPSEPLIQPTLELSRQPVIQAGAKRDTVVIGFSAPAEGRFLQFEAQVVSGELAALAKGAFEEVAGSDASGSTAELAERVRAQLVEFGLRLHLHPGLVSYLGNLADAEILGAPLAQAGGLTSLAERVRAQLVEFGVRMAAQGLGANASERPSWLLEFPTADPASETVEDRPLHAIRVGLLGERPVPALPSAPTAVYLSTSGQDAIIAWETADRLVFRETTAEGWSEERFLPLGSDLSLSQAHSLLENRLKNR